MGLIFFIELAMVITIYVMDPKSIGGKAELAKTDPSISNTEALGRVLYTEHIYYFQISGLVLLVAMIGAIVLTLRHKAGVKRQNIADQVARTRDTAIEVKKVPFGQGV